jgi:exodeoxyribonuclease VII large subunit
LKIVDVVILGRGGGSLEDLWAFNEEEVARAIYDSEIPVISAVGHEVDFSISDFVADLRAPTPSAAAEIAAPDTVEVASRIRDLAGSLVATMVGLIAEGNRRLLELSSRYGLKRPLEMIVQRAQRCDEVVRLLNLHMAHRMESRKQLSKSLSEKLEMVSPKAILGRGYAYCRDAGGVPVRSFRQVAVDDRLDVVFFEGGVESRVTRIKPDPLERISGS